MTEQRQAPISIFRSATDARPRGTIKIRRLYENIRDGWWTEVGAARAASHQYGRASDQYAEAKRCLPAVTPGGKFSHRANSSLEQHSGLVVVDFDGLQPEAAVTAREAAAGSPHVVLAFLSPSQLGIKALVRVGTESGAALTEQTHRAAWAAASAHLAELVGQPADKGKDVSRLCFVSHDPDAHYNPKAEPLAVDPQAIPVRSAPARAAGYQPRQPRTCGGRECVANPVEYAEAALRDACRQVAGAPDGERHNTLLAAAFAIGGLCCPTVDGRRLDLLEQDAATTDLFQAGIRCGLPEREAWAAARDALAAGMEAPRTLSTGATSFWGAYEAVSKEETPSTSDTPYMKPLQRAHKGRPVTELRRIFRAELQHLGYRQTHACGRVGMRVNHTTGQTQIFRMWCQSISCRWCGSHRRAAWAEHIYDLFQHSLYIAELPADDWDTRRIGVGVTWVWAKTNQGTRVVFSNAPVCDASVKVDTYSDAGELAIILCLAGLKTKLAPRERVFGASDGCGLASKVPKKEPSKDWEFRGQCKAVRTVEQALAIAQECGAEVLETRQDGGRRGCVCDTVPLRSVTLKMADPGILEARLRCSRAEPAVA